MQRPEPKTPPRLELRSTALACQVRSFPLKIKAVGEDGTIEGYGSVWDVVDAYDDKIVAGAFAATLKAHQAAGTMPAMLWQHDATEPIGVWTEMVEDSMGLRLKGKLALDTVRGREAYALLKLGALTGLSIGFIAKQWSYDRTTDIRTLIEVELWEVSLVTFPANGKARVTGVKSAADIAVQADAVQVLREVGFSKDDAAKFVSHVMRLGETRSDSAGSTARALKAADRLLASLSTNS